VRLCCMFDPAIHFLSKTQVPTAETAFVKTIDDQVYYRKQFESPIEEFLTIHLDDIEQSAFIYQKYKELILPAMLDQADALKEFETWIKQNYILLQIGALKALEELNSHPVLGKHFIAIESFLTAVNRAEELPKGKHNKIAIIIPNANGGVGEAMVAEALESQLKLQGREVKIIPLSKKEDLLYRFSGMSNEELWMEVFQKRNDRLLTKHCWNLRDELASFIPNDAIGDLRRKVDEFAPDFIISTRYSDPIHAVFATKCPLAFIHCDYAFRPQLLDLAKKTDAKRVKFWVPAEACVSKELAGRVDVLGYPIRLGIKRVDDVLPILEKWQVRAGEKVVMMQMGKQGMGGALPKLIKNIVSAEKELPPTCLVVITGTNSAMKQEIQTQLAELQPLTNITVQLHESLNEQEMNELYNIASVMIGKAGGVTTAETIHMAVYGLVFPSCSLEKPNLEHLVQINLGVELNDYDNVVALLLPLLKREKVKTNPVDWQKQLENLLRSYQLAPLQATEQT
jgi:UDP-N-acetylglucosamine:LPS N-acetylglucosamine transferase